MKRPKYAPNKMIYLKKSTVIKATWNAFLKSYFDKNLIYFKDTSAEFKEGLERLRKLLGVPTKENDHTSVLQAVSLLLEQTVNSQAEPKTKEVWFLVKLKEEDAFYAYFIHFLVELNSIGFG